MPAYVVDPARSDWPADHLRRYLATDGEDMVNRDHACFFSASHAAKDSGIALKLAKVGLITSTPQQIIARGSDFAYMHQWKGESKS